MPPPPSHPDFAEFARAFPFHLVISPTLAIQAVGDGLARLDPELRTGLALADHFALREPAGPLDWALLSAAPQTDFCLVHQRSGLELRGRMVLAEPDGPAIFLGTSWLDDAEQLADFGLSLDQLHRAAARADPAPEQPPPSALSPDAAAVSRPPAGTSLEQRYARLERCLRLHQTVSHCIAEANDFDEALALLTEALPQRLGLASATVWRQNAAGEPVPEQTIMAADASPDDETLLSSPFKGEAGRGMGLAHGSLPHPLPNPPLEGEGAGGFTLTRAATGRPTSGPVPGPMPDPIAVASRSQWAAAAADLAASTFNSGAPIASVRGCAGRGGFSIPINGDAGTVAVITCVCRGEEPVDAEFADQLYLSAGQLAGFLVRQQQKERLNRLTSELTAIFQLSPDGFVAFNDRGILSYLNPTFARMTGIERDDLRGLTEPEFERRLAPLLDPQQAARPAGNGDLVIRLRLPRLTILQRSRREARDIEGRLVRCLLYFRDITLETELLRANGDFLSNAAHELRTPMASIHGFTELLLKREFPPEQRRDILETMHGQSSRLSEIVDELLEVARFDARAARDLNLATLALGPIVETTVRELLVRGDSRSVALDLPAASAALLVRVDRDRFAQALTNVLSNAYKYSPNGGAIELSLTTRTRNDLSWVGVVVRDHGIGMNEDELGHLFERFFRARPSGSIPGTGLGMSMVKKIIDAHGGTVEVVSAPGEGTEVTLWLAVAPA